MQQCFVGPDARLEAGGVLEIPDGRVGLGTIKAVNRSIVEAAARELRPKEIECGRLDFGEFRNGWNRWGFSSNQ